MWKSRSYVYRRYQELYFVTGRMGKNRWWVKRGRIRRRMGGGGLG
jgi:hypothetical protein